MSDDVARQIGGLTDFSYEQLRRSWRELFGSDPPTYSRPYLVKRLAYRIQELHYGGLSDETKAGLREILRTSGYDQNGVRMGPARQRRQDVPVLGTRLVRQWNGTTHKVTAVPGGFEYLGHRYRSLTAVAEAITGTHCNGRA